MVIYISGGITKDFNYMAKFKKAEEHLKQLGHAPLNPTVIPPILSYEEHMVVDLAMLSVCDAIYMLKGWEDSKGANIELNHALKEGKLVFYENSIITGYVENAK